MPNKYGASCQGCGDSHDQLRDIDLLSRTEESQDGFMRHYIVCEKCIGNGTFLKLIVQYENSTGGRPEQWRDEDA